MLKCGLRLLLLGAVVRFRHPKSMPIQSVTVNGKPWTGFNKDKETITLKGLTGTVSVTAKYGIIK